MIRDNLLFKNVNEINSLSLAYIGDAIYEVYIRRYLINKGGKPSSHHKKAISFVSANAQSNIIHYIMPYLDGIELDVVKRGRNAKSSTVPKNVDVTTYRYSTAFEALLGYLFLNENTQRLEELISLSIRYVENGDDNGK